MSLMRVTADSANTVDISAVNISSAVTADIIFFIATTSAAILPKTGETEKHILFELTRFEKNFFDQNRMLNICVKMP